MPLETNLNLGPYYDDYEASAKGKNYHRILFKPGLAVQTRELTQIQSILQDQIGRFGDNIYKEGTIIDGCAFQYDANVSFVKLRDNDSLGASVTVTDFEGGIVTGQTSGVRAKVIAVASGVEADAPNYNTFLVKYIDGGTSKTNKTFALNEILEYATGDGGGGETANTINTNLADAFGFGSIFSVGEGIVYGKGAFVQANAQTIILEKYSTKPSYKVGFKITESTVNHLQDSTLLDNAAGSFNYTAPGADRLVLTPTLQKRNLTAANTEQFTPIFEVENGNIRIIRKETVFNSIGRELATRTFEESGNYQLKQMNTSVKEHLDTGSNFGRYTAGNGGDANKLAVGIEPGIAYVQGYRNEVLATDFIETDKATTTKTESGVTISTTLGNYVVVNEVAGIWDPTTYQTVSLRDTVATAITSGNFGVGGAPGSEIGTAKIRGIEYNSGTYPNYQYKIYLFDIQMSSGTFANVRSLYVNNGAGNDNFADVVLTAGNAVLQETDFNRAIFKSGATAVKDIVKSSTSFVFKDKNTVSFATGGTGTLNISGTHAGGTEEFPYTASSPLSDTQKRSILVTTQSTVNASASGTTSSANTVFPGPSSNGTLTGTATAFDTEFKVGDYVGIAANTTAISRVVSIASPTSMDVTPAMGVSSGSNVYKIFPAGYVFDLTDNGINGGVSVTERSVTAGAGPTVTQLTVDLEEAFTSGFTADVVFNVKREAADPASKAATKDVYVKLDLSTNADGVTGPWYLGVPDVYNLKAVYVGSDYSVNNKNLVDDFRILRNTNDNIYGISQLTIKESSSLTLTTADRLLVKFDYFAIDRSAGIGFFSNDSYPISATEDPNESGKVATAQIPRFASTTNRETYNLRDSIDFRATVTTSATPNATVGSAPENPTNSTTLNVDSDGSYVPVPEQSFQADIEYYLPRVDRVVIGKDGKKKVLKGKPAERPVPPQEPAEAMTLSLLTIPPYPSYSLENAYNFTDAQTGAARVDLAVRVKAFFQRRYTMQDISGLEKRIDRIEYYTALNVLEKAAKDLNIPDGSGLDRFKNGIFVDAFFGHNNADLTDPTYRISMDTTKGEIRPKFDQQNIDIEYVPGSSSNVTRIGDQVRLDVTGIAGGTYVNDHVVYLGASFGSATATGTVRTVITTGSTARIYLHSVTGTFTATSTLKNNTDAGITSTISAVQEPTAGDLVTLPYTHNIYIDQPFASKTINPVGELSFNWAGNLQLFPEADHWVDTTTQPDVQFDLDLASNWQSLDQAWGTQWNEWNTVSSTQSREVRGVAFVDFQGAGGNQGGVGFGSFGDAHSALDDVVVSTVEEQVRTGTRLNVDTFSRTQKSGSFITRTDIVPFMRSRVVQFSATGMRPNTRVYPYFDDIAVSSYVLPANSSFANTGAFGDALETDSNGAVYGSFVIPNNDTLKFRQGERPFKLVDISNLVTQTGTETTSSTANYTALGLASSERGITLNTREARVSSDTISDRRTVTTSQFEGLQLHKDPVAQSFAVGDFEFENLDFADSKFGREADGIFVSCIDLYFQAKSSTAGIGVEIREVQNGTITGIRVPFGFKRIESADVNISETADAPTPFYFDQPVYLRGDKEYAFVVKPDGSNPDYRLWIAELGGTDVTINALIDQQPAVGLLFTSANDRTYTPRQNQDIQFTIWRAQFDNALTGTLVYNNENDEYLSAERFTVTRFQTGEKVRGEAIITMTSNNNPIAVGDAIDFGTSSGLVRKLVTISATPTIKADMKGDITNGATVTFTNSSSGTFTGVVNTYTANGATGFVQYVNKNNKEIVLNGSSGAFTANTTAEDGFYRGQVTNAAAQVFSVDDYKYNVLVPKISYLNYLDTDVSWTTKTTDTAYAIDGTATDIEAFENNEFLLEEKIIAGRTSEINNTSSAKTLTVTGTLTSGTDRLSPVVDIGRTRSVVVVHNLVNNDNTGEIRNNGNAAARYITKKIVLADGQEAEDIKIILDAYKPSGTEIDVYARIQSAEDTDEFRDKQYTLLTQSTPATARSSPVNQNDFLEFEFGFPSTNATSLSAYNNGGNGDVVRYYNTGGAFFDTFKYFSIKIVLRANASNLVPRVKDLRAIALQI